MHRGEVWWAKFDEPRPVVLLSDDEPSRFRAMQVVAPADTDISGWGPKSQSASRKDCPLKACCASGSPARALPLAPG